MVTTENDLSTSWNRGLLLALVLGTPYTGRHRLAGAPRPVMPVGVTGGSVYCPPTRHRRGRRLHSPTRG